MATTGSLSISGSALPDRDQHSSPASSQLVSDLTIGMFEYHQTFQQVQRLG